jgi:hypothetical protein
LLKLYFSPSTILPNPNGGARGSAHDDCRTALQSLSHGEARVCGPQTQPATAFVLQSSCGGGPDQHHESQHGGGAAMRLYHESQHGGAAAMRLYHEGRHGGGAAMRLRPARIRRRRTAPACSDGKPPRWLSPRGGGRPCEAGHTTFPLREHRAPPEGCARSGSAPEAGRPSGQRARILLGTHREVCSHTGLGADTGRMCSRTPPRKPLRRLPIGGS